jgi:RNA polymerase sigma-70 factor (ECF subfamily)
MIRATDEPNGRGVDIRDVELTGARAFGVAAPRSEFGEWGRPHWNAMCAVATRLAETNDRDDVLQNALLLAWRRRAQFDPARGTERGWLVAITANEARKSHRLRRHVELIDADIPVDAGGPDLDLQRALRRLTRRQRLAVELHYYTGLSVAECAQVMSCAEGTVKSTLAAARDRLRAELEGDAP